MIEIEMSKDIRDFEPKIALGMTMRQLVCIGVGVAVAIPIVFKLNKLGIGFDISGMIAAMLAMPIIAAGWINAYGMKAEQMALTILYSLILAPTKRKYVTVNTTAYLTGKANGTNDPKAKSKKVKIKYPKTLKIRQ